MGKPAVIHPSRNTAEKLKSELNNGLDSGLTVNEIKEVLIHLYAYCGFPRSLNGLSTFMTVLKERKDKGIEDLPGKDASSITSGKSMLELGTEVQTTLVGAPVKGALYDFAPPIDEFLKTHLFGDLFTRDVLTYQQRELSTLGALAGMSGVNPQLQGHFGMASNTGLTNLQFTRIVEILKKNVGTSVGNNAEEVLKNYLAIKN